MNKSVIIEIRGDIANINAKLSGLQRKFSHTSAEGKKSFDNINASVSRMARQVGGAIAAVYSLGKAWEMMDISAKAEQEKRAFASLTASYGEDVNKLIGELKKASAETVDTMTLIRSAGTAMMMGIKPDEVVKLMEIARATSKMTGQAVSTAFNDIALAVGRQSRKILDNLGIIVKQSDANEAYARVLGKTAAELTDAERRAAFMNATVKAGAELMERLGSQTVTTSDRLQRFSATLKDLKVFAGGALVRTFQFLEATFKSTAAAALGLSGAIFSILEISGKIADLTPGVSGQGEYWRAQKQAAYDAAEAVAFEADQSFKDAFAVTGSPDSMSSPAINAIFGGTPDDAAKVVSKGTEKLAEEVAKAQQQFRDAMAMPSSLDLALRRGPQTLTADQPAQDLAAKYSEEFEAAKNSVSDLDQALMVTDATLSRMKAPVESFGETFRDQWHMMTDSARTDIEVLADATVQAMSQLSSGIGDAFANAVVYGQDLGSAMGALLKRVSADIISMLIEVQIQKLISHVIGKATMLSTTMAEAMVGVNLAAINAYSSTAAIPIIGPALAPAAAAAAMMSTMPFATSAIAAAASYDLGGISRTPGMYYAGVPEAHIPLKGGRIPVDISGGGSPTYNVSIHAVDAPSFIALLEKNPGAISMIMEKQIKGNQQLRRTMRRYR